jgi:hypothetical protein
VDNGPTFQQPNRGSKANRPHSGENRRVRTPYVPRRRYRIERGAEPTVDTAWSHLKVVRARGFKRTTMLTMIDRVRLGCVPAVYRQDKLLGCRASLIGSGHGSLTHGLTSAVSAWAVREGSSITVHVGVAQQRATGLACSAFGHSDGAVPSAGGRVD